MCRYGVRGICLGLVIPGERHRRPARSWRFDALLSICVAFLTIAMKAGAYLLTGSVGLLSDAAKSLINLAGVLGAFWALSTASRPPHEEHAYGHTRAEYFSSVFEGALVLVAAGGHRLCGGRKAPRPPADRERGCRPDRYRGGRAR